MTLLIAAKENGTAWMVSDTAITEGTIGLRDRKYWPKIEAAHNASLLGFAGDHHHGRRIIRAAASFTPGSETLDFLVRSNCEIGSVDLAYE